MKVTRKVLEPPRPLPMRAFLVFMYLHLSDILPIWIFENLYLICFRKNLSFKIHLKKTDTLQARKSVVTNQPSFWLTPWWLSVKACNCACWGSLLFLKINGLRGGYTVGSVWRIKQRVEQTAFKRNGTCYRAIRVVWFWRSQVVVRLAITPKSE